MNKAYDQEFLKEAGVSGEDTDMAQWMTWRSDEVFELREAAKVKDAVINKQASNLKIAILAATAGWLFAGMLMLAPIVARL